MSFPNGLSDCRNRSPQRRTVLRRRIIPRSLRRFLLESHVDSLPKQQAVRASSVMERANLFTGLDLLTFGHGDFVGRTLAHADGDKAHEADVGFVGLNEDDCTGGHLYYEGLRVVGRGWVGAAIGVGKAFEVSG